MNKYSAILLLVLGTLAICAWAQEDSPSASSLEHLAGTDELVHREKRQYERPETEEEADARRAKIVQGHENRKDDRHRANDALNQMIQADTQKRYDRLQTQRNNNRNRG